jgi:beta-galactosidase
LLEKDVLKKLYAQINIPVENYPAGITVEYRDCFGIAVNYSDKTYSLNIPSGTTFLIGTKEIASAGVSVWKLK